MVRYYGKIHACGGEAARALASRWQKRDTDSGQVITSLRYEVLQSTTMLLFLLSGIVAMRRNHAGNKNLHKSYGYLWKPDSRMPFTGFGRYTMGG